MRLIAHSKLASYYRISSLKYTSKIKNFSQFDMQQGTNNEVEI